MWRLDDWLCKSCFLRRRRPWEFETGSIVWTRYGTEDEWWPAKVLSLSERGDSYETSTYEVTLIGKTWTSHVDYASVVPFTDTLYHGVPLSKDLEESIELAFSERQVIKVKVFLFFCFFFLFIHFNFLLFFFTPETRKIAGDIV